MSRIVLYANVDPDTSNAGSLHVAGLANGFRAQGYRVQLVVPRLGPDSELPMMVGDDIELVTFPRARLPGWRTIWSVGTLLSLPRLLRLLLRRPHLIYVRDDQSTWLVHALARLLRVHALGDHNSLLRLNRDPRRTSGLQRRLLDLGQRLSCRFAAQGRAVTEGIKAELVAQGADPAKLFVVGSGSDLVGAAVPTRNACLEQFDLSPERIYVGFGGHLAWWQGCDQLLSAFAQARAHEPRLALIFAGYGEMTAELRAQAARIGLSEQVHFLGAIPYERRTTVIGAFDIACFTGTVRRNARQGAAPLKIRDYAACGRAILAARLPGLEDIAAHGAAELYTPGDVADLQARILHLAGDAALRFDMGRRAQHYAKVHFRWTTVAASIMSEVRLAK